MERIRRRFSTWLTTGIAGLALTAATASGLFQLAVEAVPGYRADVENYVRDVTGRPVRIGQLELTWRYTYPSLDLLDVALLDTSGDAVLLKAERLRLGLSVPRLIRQDLTPNRLELHGLSLDVRIDQDGRLSTSGFDAEAQDAAGGSFEALDRFDQIRLERCRLNLFDERRQGVGRSDAGNWSFGLAYAELARGGARSTLESELTLPAQLGSSALLRAGLKGDWLDLTTWEGDWSIELRGLVASTWLGPYLAPGASIESEALNVNARGTLQAGSPRTVEFAIDSGRVLAQRTPHKAGFDSLRAEVQAEFTDTGWSASLTGFEMDSASGRSPQTRARLVSEGTEGPTVLSGEAEQMRLADFTPWLPMTQAPVDLMALATLSGVLERASFRVEQAEETLYRARANFSDVSLPAGDRAVGASGLRGEVAVDQSGGRVVLRRSQVDLELPGVLESSSVPFEALEGEAQWRRDGDAWSIDAPRLYWEAAAISGVAKGSLQLPDDDRKSPELELEASFKSEDLTQAKPYMPRSWGRDLKTWLDRAIVSGSAPSATLKLAGPLRDFPFDKKPGTWEVDVEVKDALLSFDADWPPVEDINATVRFRDNGVSVDAKRGVIAGNRVKNATATIADFKQAKLVIDGTAEGDSARFFDYLSRSPLREKLDGLLRNRVSGPAYGSVHIQVPLDGSGKATISGVATIEKTELAVPGLREPFKNIEGNVSFSNRHVSAESLTARWYELPLQARIDALDDGTSLLSTHLDLEFTPKGRGPSELIPDWLRPELGGTARWAAALRIGSDSRAPLRLSTDLVGATVALPPPIGKSAEQVMPVTLTVGELEGVPLHLTVEVAEELGADLRFGRRGRDLLLSSAALRVGPGPLLPANGQGITVGGAASEVDARAWFDALDRMGLMGPGDGSMRSADLHVGKAMWGDYWLADTRYQWQPDGSGGWQMAVVGAGAAGDVHWTPGNRGAFKARLDSLNLKSTEQPGQPRPPGNPSEWPVVDLEAAKFRLNRVNLGRLQFATERIDHGQRSRVMSVTGGVATLSANGQWQRRADASTAKLEFDLATSDIASLLEAMHYAPNIEADSGRFRGKLEWDAAPEGLEWQMARGPVSVRFTDGQLNAVEPGAGRVLGLMNFMALPRRLTLNFSDVLSDGLGYDLIEGDFQLGDGNAVTSNLHVDGPSVRMETRGRVGLAARDYDQRVSVYPGVSAGVTLGALALGGPVIAVLTMIAQEIMDKPLDEVSQLSYRLTGSWDNPKVERVGGSDDDEPPKRKPGPPSQKR